jgi:hypothetical protein
MVDLLTDDEDPDRLVGEHVRWALEYVVTAYDETKIKERRESLRDNLKSWLIENCEPDENGNHTYYFPKPIIMDDREITGLQAQRRVSEYVNEDRAFNVAEQYGVLNKVTYTVTTEELDLDSMYALNQMGEIPDEAIDSIIEIKEYFALMQLRD